MSLKYKKEKLTALYTRTIKQIQVQGSAKICESVSEGT